MNQGGVDALKGADRDAVNSLFDSMAQYGIFVTRKGQLEDWLSTLQIPGKKTSWTIAMLERLGSDSSTSSYISPGQDDVWAFMQEIVNWAKNPARKGTP